MTWLDYFQAFGLGAVAVWGGRLGWEIYDVCAHRLNRLAARIEAYNKRSDEG